MAAELAAPDSTGDEDRINCYRLVAIRHALEVLWLARHHSPRCATAQGIAAVRQEALEEIRAITDPVTDPAWRPPEDPSCAVWRQPGTEYL